MKTSAPGSWPACAASTLAAGLTGISAREIFDLADTLEVLNLIGQSAQFRLPTDLGRLHRLRSAFCSR
ncbi:MAG: hypothetical protein WKG07_07580 [Hymenobacter sp.]